jgi:hypothetical protein
MVEVHVSCILVHVSPPPLRHQLVHVRLELLEQVKQREHMMACPEVSPTWHVKAPV